MVVLPAPIRESVADHPLLQRLLVTDAGYFPHATGHRVERPQGSVTHLLLLCLDGRGWARGTGAPQPVEAGDLLWFPPDQPHAYGADEAKPWTIVWAHFRGDEVPDWRQQFGFAPCQPLGLIHIDPDQAADLKLDQAYDLLEHGYSIPQLLGASAALRTTFCAALSLSQRASTNRSAVERTGLVREQLIRSPARAYRLKELATSAHLSVPHFSLLFRQQTGYAPIDFLLRQRIKNACRLLDTTGLGIAQIATEVGFADPYYFSRCFRRVMGCAPRAYRQTVKA